MDARLRGYEHAEQPVRIRYTLIEYQQGDGTWKVATTPLTRTLATYRTVRQTRVVAGVRRVTLWQDGKHVDR